MHCVLALSRSLLNFPRLPPVRVRTGKNSACDPVTRRHSANCREELLRTICYVSRKKGPLLLYPPTHRSPEGVPTGSLDRFGAAGAFPLVMPFLWEFPLLVSNEEINNAAKLPYSAASALCPFAAISIALRVARVSRLIGKSDTTAKRSGWQVYFAETLSPEARTQPKTAQTQETPLPSEWRFAVLRWSLASQIDEGGGCLLRACCRLSGRFSPF
jgi:hypothetical protein